MDDVLRPSPDRPPPVRPWPDHARAVIASIGTTRLVGGVLAAVGVVIAGWWLLRPPATPIEDRIPLASAGATVGPSADSPARPQSGGDGDVVVVHVAGAVRRPGVYRLSGGARVDDAIDEAGGALPRADLDAVNLAAVLVDGQQIYVPRRGAAPGGAAAVDPTVGQPTGPVDLNTATAEQLDVLPGVGPSTAAAIITHRDDAGPYASVDDLLDVPGIGPAKLDALRGLVTV